MKSIVGTRAEIGERSYEKMLALRHKIFRERLKWDIPSTNENTELEEDEFDTESTVYVLIGNPFVASCRLIPSNHKTMISVLWPDVLVSFDPHQGVWELSRFAVDKDARMPTLLAAKILLEAYKFAIKNNISHYVVISTRSAAKVIRNMGINTIRLPSEDQSIVASSTKIDMRIGSLLQGIVDLYSNRKNCVMIRESDQSGSFVPL